MKVIDLLNKIANGEEVPEKLKINGWEYDKENQDLEPELLQRLVWEDFNLNNQVEIIEEHKIPKKFKVNWEIDDDNTIDLEVASNIECKLADKINEILKYLEEENNGRNI